LFALKCLAGLEASQFAFHLLLSAFSPTYQKANELVRWEWANYCVASIFTGVVSLLGFHATYGDITGSAYPPPLSAAIGVTDLCRYTTLAMAGYLTYDALSLVYIMTLQKKLGQKCSLKVGEMFFHHGLGLFGTLSCLHMDVGGVVNMWVYFGGAWTREKECKHILGM
jgi:hypothetical protein